MRVSSCVSPPGSLGSRAHALMNLEGDVEVAQPRLRVVSVSLLSSILVSCTKGHTCHVKEQSLLMDSIVCQEGWPRAGGSGCGSLEV